MKKINFLNLTGVLSFIVLGYYCFNKIKEKIDSKSTIYNIIKSIYNYKLHEQNNLTIGKILILICVLFIGIKLSKIFSHKFVHKVVSKTKLTNGTKFAIENLSYYFLIFISVLISLNIAEVPLTIFTLFGGALAIGLGFGSQSILNNFISGIILQVEQPVRVGDVIEIEGTIGSVQDIGGLRTKIIASNNTHLILPNSYLLDKKLVNWTLQDNVLRCKIEIKIPYNVVHNEFKDIVLKSLEDFGFVNGYPPRIILDEYGPYSLNYIIYFWVPVLGSMDKASTEGNFRVMLRENLLKEGIHIATQEIAIINKN